MGFSAEDTDVTLLEPTALEDKVMPAVTEVEAQQRAAANRPEVFRARYEQRAAEHQSTSKFFLLLPEANLEAGYVHLFGQAFAPADSYYVGFKATWNIWEWGASWFQRQAAQRNAEAAADLREDQERQVKTEASSRLSTYRSAHSAVEVAQTAIASAEEAWRVTQALLKAGTATTTDLLDSQSALTQAKLNLVRARYQEAVAKVGVERAMGRPHGEVQ
jgi:outer membrane protein TolC